ncbi:DUF2637 domain-containing protein [Actinoplanes sp. NPDC048988]|uniref:DUF2637 domain-containing protein n=1 Tax=Actinoplanes sp. NPDC048988 TaxID=3363901 RepID=UPI0037147748
MRSINWLAVAARGSAAVVALVAGASSFRHIADVAVRYGEHPAVAVALPFAIDGLMVVATAAMIEDQRAGRSVRWSARVAFVFGVVASLGANIASAQPSAMARIVAAVPAVALLLAIEVLTRSGHAAQTAGLTASDETPLVTEVPPEQVAAVESPTEVPPVGGPEVSEPVRTINKQRRPIAETRRLAEQLASEDPSLTREAIAQRLGITPRRLRVVLNAA